MDWIRCEKLGHGSFATVHLAVPRSQNSLFPPLMAVKSCGALYSSSLTREKLILDELRGCPEIIQCFGDSNSYENGEKLYNVLLEYAPGGALSEKLADSDGHHLPEFEVRRYTKALLKGLNYIHKAGFVHCDIKLQNVLIGNEGELKIADFGLAKRVGSKEKNSGFEFRGTPLYMSPETVLGGEIEPAGDIWAFGCAVAEMITGVPAWRYSDLTELLMRIGVGDELPAIPEILSEEGKDFLRKCFVKDPSRRWTAEMLLDHPFVCCDDGDFDERVVLKDRMLLSPSPRCPFDFPEWVSSPEYSEEPFCWSMSTEERLRGIVSDQSCPDWSVSEDWVTIR